MLTKITGLIISYLIGSIPTAYIFGKLLRNIDIRKYGSGNVGATNAFRVLGKPVGIIVLFIDCLKGFLAVLLLPQIFSPDQLTYRIFIFALVFCGHVWTIFLKFKGGKGMAVSLGGLTALAVSTNDIRLSLGIALLVWLIIFLIFKFVSLASIISASIFPILLWYFKAPRELCFTGLILAVLIVLKHKSNIHRLLRKEELSIKIFKR